MRRGRREGGGARGGLRRTMPPSSSCAAGSSTSQGAKYGWMAESKTDPPLMSDRNGQGGEGACVHYSAQHQKSTAQSHSHSTFNQVESSAGGLTPAVLQCALLLNVEWWLPSSITSTRAPLQPCSCPNHHRRSSKIQRIYYSRSTGLSSTTQATPVPFTGKPRPQHFTEDKATSRYHSTRQGTGDLA